MAGSNGRVIRVVSSFCWLVAAAGAAVIVSRSGSSIEAHQTITSKYKYNTDVFPVFRDRCGRCHVDGGPAPMSLVSYMEAAPWGQSIREQLVAETMPPWYADPDGPAVKGGYAITSKELDMIVTWAAGGTPRSIEKTFFGVNAPLGLEGSDPPPYKPDLKQWRAGRPDLTLEMPAEVTVPAGTAEDVREIDVATHLTSDTWIKAVDVLPGTPSMVRDMIVSEKDGTVLTAWQPGDDIVQPPAGAAFRLPAGATLRLKIHYKKNWKEEGDAKSDRSTIGLYFAEPATHRQIQSVSIAPPASTPPSAPSGRVFDGQLSTAADVLAVRPSLDQPYASMNVEAALPSGQTIELLRLRAPQPGWSRRYWLATPVALPSGTRLIATATSAPSGDSRPAPARPTPLEVELVYTAQP